MAKITIKSHDGSVLGTHKIRIRSEFKQIFKSIVGKDDFDHFQIYALNTLRQMNEAITLRQLFNRLRSHSRLNMTITLPANEAAHTSTATQDPVQIKPEPTAAATATETAPAQGVIPAKFTFTDNLVKAFEQAGKAISSIPCTREYKTGINHRLFGGYDDSKRAKHRLFSAISSCIAQLHTYDITQVQALLTSLEIMGMHKTLRENDGLITLGTTSFSVIEVKAGLGTPIISSINETNAAAALKGVLKELQSFANQLLNGLDHQANEKQQLAGFSR